MLMRSRGNHVFCLSSSAGASIDCVLWELSRKDRQSSWLAGGEKNSTSFSPGPVTTVSVRLRQRCQGRHAMPRLMPSRAQASSVHDLACHGRPGRPGKQGRAAFSASMAAAFGAPAPARQKASPPLLIFHPITHSAGGTRPNRAAPFTCPF